MLSGSASLSLQLGECLCFSTNTDSLLNIRHTLTRVHLWVEERCLDMVQKVLTKYSIGEDGETAELRRRTGKRWFKPALGLGQRTHWMPALAQQRRSGLQPRMIEGCYVEHHTRTGSIFAMTIEGTVKGRGFNRTFLEERWRPVEFENLTGTPWQLKEPGAEVA